MISFRRIMLGDLEFINKIRNNCAEEYLHDSRKFNISETIAWYYTTNPEFYIVINDSIRVGYFRTSNYNSINKTIYIGADLDEEYRGKGIGYEMYKKFIPFICEKYNLHKIYLEVLATNEKAIRLYKKVGFEVEGVKKEDTLKNGKYIDSIIMGMIINETI